MCKKLHFIDIKNVLLDDINSFLRLVSSFQLMMQAAWFVIWNGWFVCCANYASRFIAPPVSVRSLTIHRHRIHFAGKNKIHCGNFGSYIIHNWYILPAHYSANCKDTYMSIVSAFDCLRATTLSLLVPPFVVRIHLCVTFYFCHFVSNLFCSFSLFFAIL